MKRFTFYRNSIIAETYEFEAENEDQARAMLMNGEVEVMSEEFVDWAMKDFELEEVVELDPLYRMVKDYNSVDSLVE
jgi:hypothetical protein